MWWYIPPPVMVIMGGICGLNRMYSFNATREDIYKIRLYKCQSRCIAYLKMNSIIMHFQYHFEIGHFFYRSAFQIQTTELMTIRGGRIDRLDAKKERDLAWWNDHP